MLRITIHEEAGVTRFIIEGKLAGPWVEELEKCWRAALSAEPGSTIQVHLADVKFVDIPGKELLAAMHRQGAELVADGLMARGTVEEITEAHEEGSEC